MLGRPLADPAARLDTPAVSELVENYGDGYANPILESGAEFTWSEAPARDGETIAVSFTARTYGVESVDAIDPDGGIFGTVQSSCF